MTPVDLPPVEAVADLDPETARDLAPRLAALLEAARLAAAHAVPAETARGPAPPPYTLAEASRLLRKSTPWTRRMAKRGRVPGARKVGRTWVFDRLAFDRWRSRPEVG
ncbi:MAG TPA: helix-turn-helix domain-containing protein [Candidatus Binatia bacterium]|nr:helix-turn-helix domain-containing protein [Candidatus Binatia bacterium]